MKVIDLLNKIAKGEEVPDFWWNGCTHIIKDNKIYDTYCDVYKEITTNDLNDEVEIIEEDKKIEKINITYEPFNYKLLLDNENAEDGQREILAKKINELVDEVNKLKEEK